jgi:hypothetical protein
MTLRGRRYVVCRHAGAHSQLDGRETVQIAGSIKRCQGQRQARAGARFWNSHVSSSHRREAAMQFGLNYTATLVAAGAAALAIAAAPVAAAAPTAGGVTAQTQQSCANLGGTQTECQTPGNVQVNDSPPQVDYFPYAGGGT